jgi:hypothetical protein
LKLVAQASNEEGEGMALQKMASRAGDGSEVTIDVCVLCSGIVQ